MNTTLVVVRAFATYAKGDVIADAAEIAAILASEQANHVVRVNGPAPMPVAQSSGG